MKKQVIDEKDFDYYCFHIPLKMLWGRTRERFLYSELEKLHPCFSEKMAVDKKFLLSSKGVQVGVTVMDRYILGNYRQKFPRKKLACMENGRTVFASRNEKLWRIIAFLLAVLLAVWFLVVKKQSVRKETPVLIPENTEKESYVIAETVPDLKEILFRIAAENGVIDYFFWQKTGLNNRCEIAVKKCHPEKFFFEDFSPVFSSVSYCDQIPSFSMSFMERHDEKEIDSRSDYAALEFPYEFRNLCRKEGFILQSEDFTTDGTYGISLVSDGNLDFPRFWGGLESLLETAFWGVTEIKVNEKGSAIGLSMKFSRISNDIYITQIMRETAGMIFSFGKRNKTAVKPVDMKSVIVTEHGTKNHKVGLIVHPDGKQSVYFKNEKGKIFYE